MTDDRITTDPAVMAGAPCVRGTRIPVATILGRIHSGDHRATFEAVLQDFPQLTAEDLSAALRYAAQHPDTMATVDVPEE